MPAAESGAWRPGPPANPSALPAVAAAFPGLPAEYLAFVGREDGSEGDLGVSPGWIALWPVAELGKRNSDYRITETLSGFIGFATNGGGELIAFDSRQNWRVCTIPFIPLEQRNAVQIATDFSALAKQFGVISPAG